MKKEKQVSSDAGSPLLLLVIYLLSSFFGAFLFSILALRAKRKGETVWGWLLLSLLFILIFSVLSYSIVATSSPTKDSVYFFVGVLSLASNFIALVILTYALLSKNILHGSN